MTSLEPNEKVLVATRPLFLWEPLVIRDVALFVASLTDRRVIALGRLQPASDGRYSTGSRTRASRARFRCR